MKLLRVVTVILTCVTVTVPASAFCFFPWRTYGYGYGYGCGYRSCGYVPAPCATGYGCYSGCSTCFQPSCGSCGTCSSCGTCGSTCGSSCGGGSCGATQVRKEPAPDPISNDRRSNEGAKTFDSGNYNGDPDDDRDTDSGIGEFSGSTGTDTRSDDFGAGSGSGTADDEAGRWSPGGGTRDDSAPFSLDDIPNGSDFEGSSSRKPATDGAGDMGTDTGTETGPVDFEARKPPVDEPVDDSTSGESTGTEVDSTDFLPPPGAIGTSGDRSSMLSARESRSNHFGVLSHSRLATGSARSAANATMISSGRSKKAPARWISVPRPEGRVQL